MFKYKIPLCASRIKTVEFRWPFRGLSSKITDRTTIISLIGCTNVDNKAINFIVNSSSSIRISKNHGFVLMMIQMVRVDKLRVNRTEISN